MTPTAALGEYRWQHVVTTAWERCTFCFRWILPSLPPPPAPEPRRRRKRRRKRGQQSEPERPVQHYYGEATDGSPYVAHACEPCHVARFGTTATPGEEEQEGSN